MGQAHQQASPMFRPRPLKIGIGGKKDFGKLSSRLNGKGNRKNDSRAIRGCKRLKRRRSECGGETPNEEAAQDHGLNEDDGECSIVASVSSQSKYKPEQKNSNRRKLVSK